MDLDPVIVAIITLLGTWGINKYNNNKSYEIAYKKILDCVKSFV